MSAIPKLRFPEFDGEWQEFRIQEVIISYHLGGNYQNVEDQTNRPLIKMGNIGRGRIDLSKIQYIPCAEEVDERHRAKFGDLFLNTRNTLDLVGKVAVWRDELPVAYYNSNLLRLKFEDNFFANLTLNRREALNKIRSIASGTTSVAAVYTKDILRLKFSFPSLPEQQQIASFLSSVDKKIDLLHQKKDALELYKKGLMQKIFSQEIRFKQEDGSDFPDWEEVALNKIAKRSTEKNKDLELTLVLTNSATQGVVIQTEYFDKSIANEANISGYYKVRKSDFVYNPRISSAAPVGPVSQNLRGDGVMSPLYTVFRVDDQYQNFLGVYFKTSVWFDYMRSVANQGARHDRMNITTGDFMALPIDLPCARERQKIASFLAAIDAKIQNASSQVEQMETYKKGLLQQMFV